MVKEHISLSNWRKKGVGGKKKMILYAYLKIGSSNLKQFPFWELTWWLDLIQYETKCQRESGITTKQLPPQNKKLEDYYQWRSCWEQKRV